MGTIFNLKPNVNKRNGQINLSLKKGDLPMDLMKALKKNPHSIKTMKIKLESFE